MYDTSLNETIYSSSFLIGVDEPMNLMEMDISDDSWEWYNSLAFGEKEIVDEVMDNLSYEELVSGNK